MAEPVDSLRYVAEDDVGGGFDNHNHPHHVLGAGEAGELPVEFDSTNPALYQVPPKTHQSMVFKGFSVDMRGAGGVSL